MSIYRCAACGSQSVVYDTKNEGFSAGKAIAGTIVFGPMGAVAGMNGKKKGYYNCGACGASLSYCMSDYFQRTIDNALEKPEQNIKQLTRLKMQYPNIEWNPTSNISLQSQETPAPNNRKPSDREKAQIFYRHFNSAEEYDFRTLSREGEALFPNETVVGTTGICEQWLAPQGLFVSVSRSVDGEKKKYYKFISKASESLEAKKAFMINKEAEHLLAQNREYIYGVLHSVFDESNTLHKDEVVKRIAPILWEDGITDNAIVLDRLVNLIILGLNHTYDEQRKHYYVSCSTYNDKNCKVTIITDTSEIGERVKEVYSSYTLVAKKWDRIPLDMQKVNTALERAKCEDILYLEGEIAKRLSGDKVYCTKDMQIELGCGEDYFKPIANVLQALEKEGVTEKKIERKITYYVLKGGFDRNEEKKKREAIAANNRVINDKISALESEKAQKQAIYEEFKSKIFGEGARKKKEAQQRIIQIDTEIANLKRQLR